MARKDIRKALETPLKVAMDAAFVAVAWENIAYDPANPIIGGSVVTEYVRFTFHPIGEEPKTIGTNPRVQDDGFAKCDVFVMVGLNSDRADDIAALVKAAFPIGAVFTRNAIQVQIVARSDAQGTPYNGWYYVPVKITWTVWSS